MTLTKDFIVCLEDGRHFKSLRRHLATSFGLLDEVECRLVTAILGRVMKQRADRSVLVSAVLKYDPADGDQV